MADLGAELVVGTMNFGRCTPLTQGLFAEAEKLAEQPAVDALLGAFARAGGTEIDTARVYQGGNTELLLGASPHTAGFTCATKGFALSQ
jgi:aryl-alcohol dehydrogenase-like predicted oxidoreductase